MVQTFHIHINQLVLDGLDVAPHQQKYLKAAIEARIAELLTQHLASGQPLPPQLQKNSVLERASLNLTYSNEQSFSISHEVSHTINNYLLENLQ